MDSSNSSSSIDSQAQPNKVIQCFCGVQAPTWTSSKPKIKGMKFYDCPFKVRYGQVL